MGRERWGFALTRGEILHCLDESYDIPGTDLITRWCKCILLCDRLLKTDKVDGYDDRYVARICYAKFLLGITKIDENDDIVEVEKMPDILTPFAARDELGITWADTQITTPIETTLLQVFSDVSNTNLLESIEALFMSMVDRREYKKSLRKALEDAELEEESEGAEPDIIDDNIDLLDEIESDGEDCVKL